MRRREQLVSDDDGPPAALRSFVLDDWFEASEQVPETWQHDHREWRQIRARRRFHEARRRWCAENGTTVIETFFLDRRDERPRS